jgi:hypothetical protein
MNCGILKLDFEKAYDKMK